jgi:cytoskeletal protein CcmA (bactofilin family)
MGNILRMLGAKGEDQSAPNYHIEEGEKKMDHDKLRQPMEQSELKETVISPDAEFKGSIKFKDSLRIDGNFEGEIDSQGTLFIGKSGATKAEIHVGNIIVEGKSEGNITCEDKIELRATAKIYGDITAARLTIAEGVNIIGKCSVSSQKPSVDSHKQERQGGLQDFKKAKEEAQLRVEKLGVVSSATTE